DVVRRFAFGSRLRLRVSVALWFILSALAIARGEEVARTQANCVVEISFVAKGEIRDPFNDEKLDVVFREPGGKEVRVPAFWGGGNVWKVRYSSAVLGEHSYRTESSVQNRGLSDQRGRVVVQKYSGTNPVYLHGGIRVSGDRRHFEYADGTPFF